MQDGNGPGHHVTSAVSTLAAVEALCELLIAAGLHIGDSSYMHFRAV